MSKWKEGDPHDCAHCAWGDTISRNGRMAQVKCLESPMIVIRQPSEYCKQWASTRGLSTDWVDKAKLPSERATRYKCLCMDAATVMKHILGNTSIPFRDQRARIAQWEADFARAKENDVDIVK